jgi:hypothetical protein
MLQRQFSSRRYEPVFMRDASAFTLFTAAAFLYVVAVPPAARQQDTQTRGAAASFALTV